MALLIKYVTGPNAGHEVRIDTDDDEVTFGRDAGADVGFPVDLTIVSRDHFRLRREAGAYKFVVSKERPVFLNGRLVIDGQELPKTAEIQLSKRSGPKLRIQRLDTPGANVPETEILTEGEDIADIVASQRAGGRRLGSWLAGITVALALVAGGYYLLQRDVANTQGQLTDVAGQVQSVTANVADINARIPALSEQIAAAQAAQTPELSALIAQHRESVYRVSELTPGGAEASSATAWVVQLQDGTKALATNSHVAEMFIETQEDPDYQGYSLRVTQPKGPDFPSLKVIGVKKHPAYDPYNDFWVELVNEQSQMEALAIEPMLGYDVALLFVDKPELLGEPLKLAPPEKLAAISAGERLLLIGYPAENVSTADWTRPEPTSQQGMVTSNTSFFLARGAYDENQLIQHSIPSAGGASGSPIFNLDGEVVGLHNAGSYMFVKLREGDDTITRIGSSALINYAQRVDLLQELIDGTADAKVEGYKAFWQASAERLWRQPEDVIKDLLGYVARDVGGPQNLKEVVSLSGTADRWEKGLNARIALFEVKFEEAGRYYFIGWSGDRRKTVAMMFDSKGDLALKGSGGGYMSVISLTALPANYGTAYVAIADDYTGEGEDTRPPAETYLKIYRAPPEGS